MSTSENATCWVVLLINWFHYLGSLMQNKYSDQESQKSFSLYSFLDTNFKWGSKGVIGKKSIFGSDYQKQYVCFFS